MAFCLAGDSIFINNVFWFVHIVASRQKRMQKSGIIYARATQLADGGPDTVC